MTKDSYIRLTGVIREKPARIRLVQWMDRILTAVVFLAYPLFLGGLLWEKNAFLLRAVVVPAVSFFLLSIFRNVLSAPRPYEKYGVPPVLEKETKGKSFPSRHVFSAFLIAGTVFFRFPLVGAGLGICGGLLAVIRVIGGVHEPKDVVAGALSGIFCALLECL